MKLAGFKNRGIPARHFRERLFPRPFLAWPEGSGVQTNLDSLIDEVIEVTSGTVGELIGKAAAKCYSIPALKTLPGKVFPQTHQSDESGVQTILGKSLL